LEVTRLNAAAIGSIEDFQEHNPDRWSQRRWYIRENQTQSSCTAGFGIIQFSLTLIHELD